MSAALGYDASPGAAQTTDKPPSAVARQASAAEIIAKLTGEGVGTYLPVCSKPLGTIAIVAPKRRWWREFELQSPVEVIRVFVRQSGCFTIVEQISVTDKGEIRRRGKTAEIFSKDGIEQPPVADYIVRTDIVQPGQRSGVTSSSDPRPALGADGAGIGIDLKKGEANVILSVINPRMIYRTSIMQGHVREADVSVSGSEPEDWMTEITKINNGEYQNTVVGRMVTRAYLIAFNELVEEAGYSNIGEKSFSIGTSDAAFLPWPPPDPSGFAEVSRFFKRSKDLGGLSDQIRNRLADRGYEKLHHFSVPGGFGVTTDAERIGTDGRPAEDRWSVGKRPSRGGFMQYVTDLFLGTEGRFRVFAFIVTNEDPAPAGYKATQMDIDRWKMSGKQYLSSRMAMTKVAAGTKIWLLVYEFEKSKSKGGALIAPDGDGLPLKTHMRFLGLR